MAKKAKEKVQRQVACVEESHVPATAADNTSQEVKKPLSKEEIRIAEIKKKASEKKIAELEKSLAEMKKKGIDIGDNEKDFVPLSEEEKAMVAQWRARIEKATKSPVVFTYTLDKEGKQIGSIEPATGYPLSPKDKFEIWQTAVNLGTGSFDHGFGMRLFTGCIRACGIDTPKENTGTSYTAVFNAMQALKPQDEVEGMLITRLISLHEQSMKYLGYTNIEKQTTEGIDNNINRSTKLSRLYNETLEALMRYRRRGEQRVVVQHVQVNDGGKAVVGGVLNQGGGGVGQQ